MRTSEVILSDCAPLVTNVVKRPQKKENYIIKIPKEELGVNSPVFLTKNFYQKYLVRDKKKENKTYNIKKFFSTKMAVLFTFFDASGKELFIPMLKDIKMKYIVVF
ncbi:hypothetical protein ACOME3_000032 [Neoechinorhynchus agilis]